MTYKFVTREEAELRVRTVNWVESTKVVNELLAERDAYREVAIKCSPGKWEERDKFIDTEAARILEGK